MKLLVRLKKTVLPALVALAALCLVSPEAGAQTVVFYGTDVLTATSVSTLTGTFVDAENEEPLAFASVYLTPVKDTIITHFSLTDQDGKVTIKEIPAGRYTITAEYVGYKAFTREYLFSRGRGLDLGSVKMEKDPEALEAARVTAAANAVTIARDTITYNASSFRVGTNATLGDLLKKMPGIEVGQNGSVKVNGETVSKITVGGKTFFFNDTAVAVNNLPAKIVDKVKVIDKVKEEAEGSGMVTVNDKEKVMDLELKEEYKNGWFGNATIGGGAEILGNDSNELHDSSHPLYTGSLLVAGYNEKDNLTIIANGSNTPAGGVAIALSEEDDMSNLDLSSVNGGLTTSAQAGANLNTTRIKGFETTAYVNYRYNQTDRRNKTSRTAFQDGADDLVTESGNTSLNTGNSVSAALELSNLDKSRINFRFEPKFSFSKGSTSSASESESQQGGVAQNDSRSQNSSNTSNLSTSGMVKLATSHDNKQYFTVTANYSFGVNDGDSRVISQTNTLAGSIVKNLLYDNGGRNASLTLDGQYSAQIAEKLKLKMDYKWTTTGSSSSRDAFNPDGSENDYYTSWSKNRYNQHKLITTLQHAFKGTNFYTLGFSTSASLNETEARSLGVTTQTGIGDWKWAFAPEGQISYSENNSRLSASVSSSAIRPSNGNMSQLLDISNPVQISTGNIYLKTYVRSSMRISYSYNNRKTFSYLTAYLIGQLTTRPLVNASWYDDSGIRYFVPVNARRSQPYMDVYLIYRKPFGKDRKSAITVSADLGYNSNSSFQSLKRQEGIDQTAFDYNTFMASFWGTADGDRFYSGQSGFTESVTKTFTQTFYLAYSGNFDALSVGAQVGGRHDGSSYSISPSSDRNTWDFDINANGRYTTDSQWEISSSIAYTFYKGYTAGYAEPQLVWNANVSKSFKNVTLSLQAKDLLNQQKSFHRSISAEYIQDQYTNIIGRYILLKVTFNFGKSNAAQSAKSRSASINMMM